MAVSLPKPSARVGRTACQICKFSVAKLCRQRSDGMGATVDVEDLAAGGTGEVGEEEANGVGNRTGIVDPPTERRLLGVGGG